MAWMWLRRLDHVVRQRQVDADVRAELEFHREMKQLEVEARGVPVAAAAIAARRAMGNLTSAREDARAVWVWPWLETIWQDTAYSARIMRRQAGSALLAVLLLAVTIGLNTSLMAVLNGLLLRPWPGVGHGRDVVTLYLNESRSDSSGALHELRSFTRAHWEFLAKQATSLASLSAFRRDVVQLGPDGTLGPAGALLVSGNFFDTLQLQMSAGRGFQADEDRTGMPRPVVVLSDRTWRARFAGADGIVGRPLVINGRPFTIVGVASPEFGFSELGSTTDVFLPSASSPLLHPADSVDGPHDLVGRLAPGATREQVQAELNVLSQQFDTQQGSAPAAVTVTGTAFTDHPGRAPILFASALVSAGLLAVWIVVCANVGNLLLAQATARGREIGIRLAIGASRPRVVRQLLTEGFIVALAAAGLGLALAYTLPLTLLRFIAEDATARFPFLVTPDAFVISFAVLMAALSAVLFGLAPALHATGVNVAKRLGGREGLAFSGVPLRSVLLAIQVAVSVVLLIVAGLLVTGAKQQSNLLEADFATDVTVVSFNAPVHAYDAARTRSWMTDLTAALRDLGLSGFALTSQEPFSRQRTGFAVRLPGEAERDRRFASSIEISPGYFALLKIPFVGGRDFEAVDRDKPVAVINEKMAHRSWPNADPIGKTFMMFRSSAPFVVVGVTKDVHLNAAAAVEPTIFTPFGAVPATPQPQLPKLLFRSDSPGASDAVKKAASRIDSEMSIRAARLTAVIKGDFMSGPGYYGRILAQVLGGFALALATVGMFGVFAYAVRQRTREIGMRMALGARPPAIIRLILLGHSRVVLVGLAVGLFAAITMSIVLRSSLPGVGRFDALVYAGVGLVLSAAALAASYLPARRATRVEPVIALRCE